MPSKFAFWHKLPKLQCLEHTGIFYCLALIAKKSAQNVLMKGIPREQINVALALPRFGTSVLDSIIILNVRVGNVLVQELLGTYTALKAARPFEITCQWVQKDLLLEHDGVKDTSFTLSRVQQMRQKDDHQRQSDTRTLEHLQLVHPKNCQYYNGSLMFMAHLCHGCARSSAHIITTLGGR